MRPDHIGALISIGDPRVAPGGDRIVYTEQQIEADQNRYVTAVWLTDLAGSRRSLASDNVDASMARWSPDGTRIAFVQHERTDDAPTTIELHDIAAGTSVTVCTPREAPAELEWAPDGTRLAFVARDPDPAYYPAPGETRKAKDTPARNITHFFSREDGEDFTFDRPTRVFVVAAAEGAEPVVISDGVGTNAMAWSPDSASIAFCAARHDNWDLDLATDVWVVSADGGPPRQLTETRHSYTRLAWSPDGSQIATVWDPSPFDGPRHGRVAVLDASSGARRTLTEALDRNCAVFPAVRSPVWDGTEHLLFTYEDEGRVTLARVAVGATEQAGDITPIVDGDRCVTGFDQCDGTLAVVIATPSSLPELHVRTTATGPELRCLTDATARFRAATGSEPALSMRFTARSSDGAEVECWAFQPEGDGPFPTLLNIHGGPFTQYGYKFFDEFQLQVGAGFAVVCCNPRGSSGYSEAWGRAVRWPECASDPGTGWGGIDYDDVLACVDTAMATFDWIDGDRLGTLGGSYGGYLTSWIIGHTQRFKAACSERSVNNLVTEEHNSDIATVFRDYVGVSIVDDPAPYVRASPVTYVREMHTPLLILHSEQDLRCPINQAEELFVALRLLGRTPEFWRFPGESHELSRSGAPKHRVQRTEIILDFFGRHLQQR